MKKTLILMVLILLSFLNIGIAGRGEGEGNPFVTEHNTTPPWTQIGCDRSSAYICTITIME